jgi:hypothetical protein
MTVFKISLIECSRFVDQILQTNRCAVIAPKILADHLENSENISNEDIRWSIESKCPPLLSAIRQAKHEQIGGNGFLNPADVATKLPFW